MKSDFLLVDSTMHHHPPSTTTIGSAASGVTSTQQQQQQQQQPQHTQQQQRRRKKRPNYGSKRDVLQRIVEVKRGYNLDFGFTISGQQPCRLSCIVPNSPAEKAGLRPGDFLISVNGLNVSKLPHETVVQLIGNSFGSIRMQIAENYFSDSSDEENAAAAAALMRVGASGSSPLRVLNSGTSMRTRPRYLHHKAKMHRLRNSPQKKRQQPLPRSRQSSNMPVALDPPTQSLRPLIEDIPMPNIASRIVPTVSNSTNTAACSSSMAPSSSSVSGDVANVSAMVRVVPSVALEYRAVVGYLGTIEMPKQISHSSKLQTVRSCIRKLRQEKRQPTTVLMTILPDCLRLQSANGNVLATYASARLNYVSSSSESENRFFGLVTSAVHTSQADDDDDDEDDISDVAGGGAAGNMEPIAKASNISISNSCHVFVIDTKLCDHQIHISRAAEFRLQCTRDPISSLCLEFPRHAEYVVNLIRSMYTMRILPPATRQNIADDASIAMGQQGAAAHSPQPSNHSEISTTTSNSDSGIGFHNDCANISDRILVVDFPGALDVRNRRPLPPSVVNPRPLGIFNNFDPNCDNRLTVRAMPDPKTISPPPRPPVHSGRPDLLANFNLIKSPGACSLSTTRSCDDVLNLVERTPLRSDSNDVYYAASHASMDDLALADEACFLQSSNVVSHKPFGNSETYALLGDCRSGARSLQASVSMPHKLSPQVFVTPKSQMLTTTTTTTNILTMTTITPSKLSSSRYSLSMNSGVSASTEELRGHLKSPNGGSSSMLFDFDMDTWSSLQNLHARVKHEYRRQTSHDLEATNSEPDLGNRALPSNASPFRRAWGQSSFRTPRTDKHIHSPTQHTSIQDSSKNSPLVRRAASMTASDNDVYIKSMNGYVDELKQAQLLKLRNHNLAAKIAGNHNNNNNNGAVVNFKTPAAAILATKTTSTNNIKPLANEDQPSIGGVATWGSSFERLLEDAAGLHTFAEFLKKEFSAENIYFWTACERFRQTESQIERVAQARVIFNKHLANGSLEPVNVDSQARNLSEEKLQNAERDIFAPAQKQIFNLMKFDSYQRFIRSDLYKSCQEAEEKQQPLPYSAETLDELLRLNIHKQTASAGASSKLKKSASNAEDRRRKSLLPWHRKTRSKSRDRCEAEALTKSTTTNSHSTTPNQQQHQHTPSKLPLLTTSSSLKIPSSSHNSLSDIHSSRSSLSSFDAVTANVAQVHAAEIAHSLCRVILSDGATTIVQTRVDETVKQLVERLLEKRGLSYKHYDVIAIGGSSKSIDLQSNAFSSLAGKEVHIEQRVAFKLDLPDPKVISVKSKPKKVLHEVIRPILHKYNYTMDSVQVFVRDTQALLDLSLPVTVVDGQRLQIVLLRQSTVEARAAALAADYQNSSGSTAKFMRPAPLTKSSSVATMVPAPFVGKLNSTTARNGMPQSTLDEITNKVFNELLQGKVEAHATHDKPQLQQQQSQITKMSDLCSIKSDDSETSSLFDRTRRRDSTNIPAPRTRTKKKSISSQNSEEAGNGQNIVPPVSTATANSANVDVKKPIIAKLKAGVKLQVTERVNENQDDLLEGLKRAQLARLEDQRGTEINIELPEFLKHKENISAAASKLRKVRASLSPINTKAPDSPTTTTSITTTSAHSLPIKLLTSPIKSNELMRPQPAPRLSITNRQKASSISPMKIDEEETTALAEVVEADADATSNSETMTTEASSFDCIKGPPPLPPKPKVLPIKPSNWGVSACSNNSFSSNTSASNNSKIPIDASRKLITNGEQISTTSTSTTLTTAAARCAYLEEPTSSFV